MSGLMARIWTEETVVAAICGEFAAGHELSYLCTAKRVPALVRAAERVFGSWGAAVNAAGFDYEAIRRYRKWSKARVLERIREWHAKGADLSWRHVSTELDPPLAAAVLHGNRFASWSEALHAAGLDPEQISRYRSWSPAAIQSELTEINAKGLPLTRQKLAQIDGSLLAALYRHGNGLVAERNAISNSRYRDHKKTKASGIR